MKNYRGVRRWLNAVLALGVAGMLTFAGCTEVDDTLGYELVPGNQQMEMRLHSIRKGFDARMFMSDSVKSSNLSYGYFGTTKSDTFGMRKVGFLTQYLWASITDRIHWYGYRPIFDSMQLLVSVSSYAGDTIEPQRFGVYRILNNDYLKNNDGNGNGTADTTFFTNFDPVKAGCVDENRPLFTFTFPDGKTTGPATTAITMEPTPDGLEYVKELMAYTTELGLQMADFYLEEGVDVIVPVDPVVSQISPTHFKNFVFEPYAKIFGHIRNKGAFSSFFVCGNATHILELMCQTKPDSLAVDENVNIVAAHKLTDSYDVAIGGNIPLTTALLLGTQLDNMKVGIDLIDSLNTRKNFIFSPG